MIEKIINNYYINKFERQLFWMIGQRNLDFKLIKYKTYFEIKIKKPKYEKYELLTVFSNDDAINCLINWNFVQKNINDLITTWEKNQR